MICVLCQFDPPADPDLMKRYITWFAGDGLRNVLGIEELDELRVYKNYSETSPMVTAMLFFPDVRPALQAAQSPRWHNLLSNLTKWKCKDITLTVLVPTDMIPDVINPQQIIE